MFMFITQTLLLYDNTVQSTVNNSISKEPCLVDTTEHFSLRDGIFTSGQLSLHSTRLIRNTMDHLNFLISIDDPIYHSTVQKKWTVILPFKKVFEYTPLTSTRINATNACHPFLVLQKNGSIICKHNSEVRYTLKSCSAIVRKLTTNEDPPPVVQSRTNLQDGVVYHMVEQADGSFQFSYVNDETIECSALVAQP
jgi:hypothetical protein